MVVPRANSSQLIQPNAAAGKLCEIGSWFPLHSLYKEGTDLKSALSALAVLILVVVVPGPACGDVDGCFCIGQEYVAVEARGIYLEAAEPTVYVVFIEGDKLSSRAAIDAPGNDNRRLRCERDRIIISDGTVIDIADPGNPKVLKAEKQPKTVFSDDFLPLIRESKALIIPSLMQVSAQGRLDWSRCFSSGRHPLQRSTCSLSAFLTQRPGSGTIPQQSKLIPPKFKQPISTLSCI